jgi:hypothetical protein
MPWLAPYRSLGAEVAVGVVAGQPVWQALNTALQRRPLTLQGALDLRFVAQTELPPGEAYEAFIARTGCVPTRDNPHDLLNGLVWLHFGNLKRRLNAMHAAQIGQGGVRGTRGRVRDALTLFDENAALLQAPAGLVDALRSRDWRSLFVYQRAAWQGATLTLFGHALLEKLLHPRKAITAHVWVLSPSGSPQGLADLLTPTWLAENPHLPLPVLGVPGWWAANEEGNFYADDMVFRPARHHAETTAATPASAGL